MAIAMLMEWEGVTQEQYDRVMEGLRLDENPPEGGIVHIAGPAEGGWHVLDVWESADAWERFSNERLAPVHAAFDAGRQRLAEAALDVDVTVEIGLEQADVAKRRDAPVGARPAEHQGELGHADAAAEFPAVGEADRERDRRALAGLPESGLDEGSHGQEL